MKKLIFIISLMVCGITSVNAQEKVRNVPALPPYVGGNL